MHIYGHHGANNVDMTLMNGIREEVRNPESILARSKTQPVTLAMQMNDETYEYMLPTEPYVISTSMFRVHASTGW